MKPAAKLLELVLGRLSMPPPREKLGRSKKKMATKTNQKIPASKQKIKKELLIKLLLELGNDEEKVKENPATK